MSVISTTLGWRISLAARASMRKRASTCGLRETSGCRILNRRATADERVLGIVDRAHAAAAQGRHQAIAAEDPPGHLGRAFSRQRLIAHTPFHRRKFHGSGKTRSVGVCRAQSNWIVATARRASPGSRAETRRPVAYALLVVEVSHAARQIESPGRPPGRGEPPIARCRPRRAGRGVQIPDADRNQILFEHDATAFEIAAERTPAFTLVEIVAFPGRSIAAKRNLYQSLASRFEAAGVSAGDLFVVITERHSRTGAHAMAFRRPTSSQASSSTCERAGVGHAPDDHRGRCFCGAALQGQSSRLGSELCSRTGPRMPARSSHCRQAAGPAPRSPSICGSPRRSRRHAEAGA